MKPVRRLTLLSAVSTLAITGIAAAQETDADEGDVVIVRGVRGAQAAAIDVKRNSGEIVDSIVSEDIGKLPDVTIADALQRIPGIQIDRVAGEGNTVSIRGSRDVLSTLNGERFITAESLLQPRAAFQDIPASLVSGVNAYKSQNASQLDGGIGGILDILTIQSLDLDEGLTASGSIQARYGSITEDSDPLIEGLVGYNFGKFAHSLSFSYSDQTQASTFQDVTEQDYVDEYSTWICGGVGCGDLNGDGDDQDFYLTPLGWSAAVNNRDFARERLGLAYNFNGEISEAWEVVADVFYNSMDEVAHGQQLFVNGGFANRSGFGPNNGSSVSGLIDGSDLVGRWHPDGDVPLLWATDLTFQRTGFRGGVNSSKRDTEALNTNLQFNYDNGGPLTGSVRVVYGDAERNFSSITIAQQTNSRCIPTSQAEADAMACTEVNPGEITGDFTNTVRQGQDALFWSVDPSLATAAADPAAWYLHSNWLESNFTEASQTILRADGKWDTGGSVSFEFGARFAERDTTERRADYFSPSGIPGLLNKFGEVGYATGQSGVAEGTAFGLEFDPLPFFGLDGSQLSSVVTTVNDFNVPGLDVALPMINTRAVAGNFEAFRDGLYGQGQYITAPDRSYGVDETQAAAYLKANFDLSLTELLTFWGNAGLRVVNTEVEVTQNEVDGGQLRQDILAGVDPNHTAYVDLGDIVTTTDRTAYLPSLSLNLDVGEDIRFKFAFQELQTLQPFENLGRGEITFFNTEEQLPDGSFETFQRVSTVQRLGNPELDPTEASTVSVAFEWYPLPETLFSLGYFKTEVDSFTFQNSIAAPDLADSDGVVRRGGTILEIANGVGASFEGFEVGLQTAFTYLPGLLSNFGMNLNYTYSPSENGFNAETGEELILAGGDKPPFNFTSEHQANAILFYQKDKLQLRLAANYLSEQYTGAYNHWSYEQFPTEGAIGIGTFLDEQLYVDFGGSYDINERFQVFVNGSNLTEEAPVSYRGFEDYRVSWNQFERIWSLGVRARF